MKAMNIENAPITSELIEVAASLKACPEALDWLRAEQRTFGQLLRHKPHWFSWANRFGLVPLNLCDADLRGTNLCGVDLIGAYLSGADLRRAYLSGASLRGADLHGAKLSGANLREADLRGADLREATLSGADLSDAKL